MAGLLGMDEDMQMALLSSLLGAMSSMPQMSLRASRSAPKSILKMTTRVT
jgi:hypothetical protein